MGSSPTQPYLSPKSGQPQVKNHQSQLQSKKSIKNKAVKQEIIEEPKKQLVVKVAPKELAMRTQIDQSWQNIIEAVKDKIKTEFKLRFIVKCYKKQIRAIFSESQKPQEKSQLQLPSHFQSEEKFQKMFVKDLKIYQEILQMRLKAIISHALAQKDHEQLQNQQTFSKMTQSLLVVFRLSMITLLGEIQGKTSVWHSLSLSQSQLVTNIINFCHQQGIDSSNFDFLSENKQI